MVFQPLNSPGQIKYQVWVKVGHTLLIDWTILQDMVNELDKDATGYLQFPNFLSLMSKRYNDQNAEDEIREAFRVFDGVSPGRT